MSRLLTVVLAAVLAAFPALSLAGDAAFEPTLRLTLARAPEASWIERARLWNSADRPPTFYLAVARPLAADWNASWSVLLPEGGERAASWASLRLDRILGGDSGSLGSRDPSSWRHFLGIEYTGVENVTFLGGVAKSGLNRGGGPAPTGYEGLRLNTGARWRGESWGLDGNFAWIPGGADRAPADAAFLPGAGGNSGPAYLFSLTVSRRF